MDLFIHRVASNKHTHRHTQLIIKKFLYVNIISLSISKIQKEKRRYKRGVHTYAGSSVATHI